MNQNRRGLPSAFHASSLIVCAALLCANSLSSGASTPVTSLAKDTGGMTLHLQSGTLRPQVWAERVIRVTFSPGDHLPADASLAVVGKPASVKWELKEKPGEDILSTPAMPAGHPLDPGMVFDKIVIIITR